ncbi:MAG: type II toxin-antitoxin system RelE/ParE family toxin [Gammaproteobacteria bacterium]
MIGYRYLPPAEEELIEAGQFYESEAAGLGAEFLDEVQRAIDVLREYPRSGRPVGRNLRRALLNRFPFSLIYASEQGAILVIAVAHQRRRPGYWRRRISRRS